MTSEATFREVRRYRSRRGWLLAAGVTLLLAALAAEADSAVLWVGTAAVGGGLLGGLATLRLTVEVRPEGLYVEYRPLHRGRLIPHGRIEAVRRRRYRPATRLGRWGLRLGLAEPTYNVDADDGVSVRHVGDDGERRELTVGSERAEALIDALESTERHGRGGGPGGADSTPSDGVSPRTSDGSRRPA